MAEQTCLLGGTHPLVVDDLDNDSKLALGGTLVKKDHSADLDESLEVGGSLNRLEEEAR
jgi:hypothetical protein